MRILLIRLSSLGDIVLTEPITRELRRIYPCAEICYLTKRQFADIVQTMQEVDRIYFYEKSVSYHISLLKQYFDIVIDIHSKASTYIMTLLLKSGHLVRYSKLHSKRRRIVRDHLKSGIDSTLELYQTALEKLPSYDYKKLSSPIIVEQSTADIPTFPTSKIATALFPGATHNTKQMPPHKLKELIREYSSTHLFYLLGSPSERDLCVQIASNMPESCVQLCGEYSIAQLVYVISKMDLVITNDSGPMHIAAALGKQQIAFFGATHPSLGFKPLNAKAHIVCTEPECQPCSLHGSKTCPRGDFICMNSIDVKSLNCAMFASPT